MDKRRNRTDTARVLAEVARVVTPEVVGRIRAEIAAWTPNDERRLVRCSDRKTDSVGAARRVVWARTLVECGCPIRATTTAYGNVSGVASKTLRVCEGIGAMPLQTWIKRGRTAPSEPRIDAKLLIRRRRDGERLSRSERRVTDWVLRALANTYTTEELGEYDPMLAYLPPGGHPDADLDVNF